MDVVKLLELIFEHRFTLIVGIGIVVLLLGASGGIPFIEPPLMITAPLWRIGLGSVGCALIVFGAFLMWRETRQTSSSDKYKSRAAYEGIRSPVRGYEEDE